MVSLTAPIRERPPSFLRIVRIRKAEGARLSHFLVNRALRLPRLAPGAGRGGLQRLCLRRRVLGSGNEDLLSACMRPETSPTPRGTGEAWCIWRVVLGVSGRLVQFHAC